jgi:diguanylate cyclase (GGDEF)-like protein
MRLTLQRLDERFDASHASQRRLSRPVIYAFLAGSLAAIFWLDRITAAAPIQHLYYLPIILASFQIGRRSGLGVASAAIVLYHLANPVLLASVYKESDVVQIALFLAVAIVTARLAENARHLHGLATTDDLTGLHNLRSFEARLTRLVRASREAGLPLAMLALDVDRLKSINDVHGHLAGAEAVRTVGHILAASLPHDAVACRYGGDEFVVALSGRTSEQAREIADEVRRAVNTAAAPLAGTMFLAGTLSVSVGVACLAPTRTQIKSAGAPDDTATGEGLFKAADRALYQAKNSGRNRVCVLGTPRATVLTGH